VPPSPPRDAAAEVVPAVLVRGHRGPPCELPPPRAPPLPHTARYLTAYTEGDNAADASDYAPARSREPVDCYDLDADEGGSYGDDYSDVGRGELRALREDRERHGEAVLPGRRLRSGRNPGGVDAGGGAGAGGGGGGGGAAGKEDGLIRAYAITPMKRLPNFCTRAGRQLIADDTLTRAFLGRAADLNVGAGERMFNSALGLLAFGVKVYLLLAFFRELKEVRFSGLELIKAVWPRSTA